MTRVKTYLVGGLGLAIITSALVPSTVSSAPPTSTANVNVVNTSDNPVPMVAQGTMAIAGSVGINGTPSVVLASGASVGVNNTALNPVVVRSVDDTVRQVFQKQVSFDVPGCGQTASVPIPPQKRLVIEHVSAAGIDNAPDPRFLRFELATFVNGVQVQHFLHSGTEGASGAVFGASQQMRIYAEPPHIMLAVAREYCGLGSGISASATMSISGYYVDLP